MISQPLEFKKRVTIFENLPQLQFRGTIQFAGGLPSAEKNYQHSSVWLKQKYKQDSRRINFLGLKSLALVCLAASILGFTSLILPVAAAELNFRLANLRGKPLSLSDARFSEANIKLPTWDGNFSSAYDYLERQKETQTNSKEFKIIIPKINLESNVIANVDPGSEDKYKIALKSGVAHAKGSYLPGEGGTTFLFAHSTDSILNILEYSAKFYAVKNLEIGDEIIINYGGNRLRYLIQEKKVINPNELETIRNSSADLILSTCYPPGTNWQRLLIFAKLQKEAS